MTDTSRIKDQVEKTYDAIAPYFARTREKVWPPTADFIREVSPCMLGDLGCGTGRALVEAAARGSKSVGIDGSSGQLELARRIIEERGSTEGVELLKGDLEDLPLDDEMIDNSIMIASLHHIPSRVGRIRALKEAFRITKDGGRIQISVWTWDQDRFRERHLSRIEKRRDTDELDGPCHGDFIVPWKKGEPRDRFYHLYGHGELEIELSETDWIVQRSFFDGRNHWVECIKVP